MNQPISMLRSNNPINKKDREAHPILQIKDIATTIMEAVLDQEVAVGRVVLLLVALLAVEWVVDSSNTRILLTITLMPTNREETQAVKVHHQVELHRRLPERILQLNTPVTQTLWIKRALNSNVQTQLSKRFQKQHLQLTLLVKVCRLEESVFHRHLMSRKHYLLQTALLVRRATSKMKAFLHKDLDSFGDSHRSSKSGKRISTSCRRARWTSKSWRVWWRTQWRRRCRWRSRRSWTVSRARLQREASWCWQLAPRRR